MPTHHYENFPVASLLLPRRLRHPVAAIYRFARTADDLADEGDATPEERLAALARFDAQLERIGSGHAPRAEPAGAMFATLAAVITTHRLPIAPFRDLLSAFMQDVRITRYDDEAALFDYCLRSANPVGRLMLRLYDADSSTHRDEADAICTALQLINFWQDVAIDLAKGRIYLPRSERERFEVSEAAMQGDAQTLAGSRPWRALMSHEVASARALILRGAPLALRLPGRTGFELRLVVQGGLRILEKIETVEYDVLTRRPTLARIDWIVMLWRALTMRA